MSDDELRHLSPEQVIALVRRLEARVAELEAELGRRGGPPKTPRNSSTPPSKGFKRERAADKGTKRGPPFGHPGTSRQRAEPDWIVLCQPTHCVGCGADLAGAPHERVGTSQVVELPPVQPVVLEAWRYAATCSACGATTSADSPAGFEPTRVFGPHLEALWTYFHEQHHVSYARLARLGQDLWQLPISQGALANALRRAAQRLRPQATRIGGRGAGEPGNRLGRDERAGARADALAVGVPDADRELPRDRAAAQWRGRARLSRGRRA